MDKQRETKERESGRQVKEKEREGRVQIPGVRVRWESWWRERVDGGSACGSAEESVIISSISDKGSVINTDLVSGSLLASPCAACNVALA